MTVTEALKVLQQASAAQSSKAQPRFEVFLACGFTPLHLQLFLGAHVQNQLPNRRVETATGVFGSLATSLEALSKGGADAAACAIEWADLDPRLGYREGGAWSLDAVREIVAGSSQMLNRLSAAIHRIPSRVRVAISTPTLPIPPLFHPPGWLASEAELLLDRSMAEFAANIVQRRGTAFVNARRLNEDSPPSGRLDLKSDLATGLPYTLVHADRLAAAFANLLAPSSPKKAIISDLDDTLWHGLVGEVGPNGVCWDLASHQQLHGLYQKVLSSLADAGVLIAIASKNDLAVVQKAFERHDLLLRPDQVFPFEVHWNPKSGSVGRILEAWNIGSDSVIFVDDSPLELAEVAISYPDITCIPFPKNNPAAVLAMLRRLRDLCGKEEISAEDGLRLESLRRGAEFARELSRETTNDVSPEAFFQQMEAVITVDTDGTEDARALELVNKTNQFNINGIRISLNDWQRNSRMPGAITLVVSYRDKFGPLGKIAVMQGRREAGAVFLTAWVMSCRAFARRIEYQCLKLLFEKYGVREIVILLTPTPKNKPAQEFIGALANRTADGTFRLAYAEFAEKCPTLYHHVLEVERVEQNG